MRRGILFSEVNMKKTDVDRIVKLGLLTALSVLLVLAVHFPIFPSAPFLEYDMGDVPILIGTFLFGPWWGLLLTLGVSVLQGLTVSASGGLIGILMHAIATGGFALVAGCVYRVPRLHTFRGAILALVLGGLTMTVLMVPLNLVFTGYFMGTPTEVVKAMLVPVIIPFNLAKAGINGVVTILVYKAVGRVLKLDFIK